MRVIQAVVIVVAVLVAIAVLIGPVTYASRAWKKILVVLLSIGMIVTVLVPSATDRVAEWLGVGSGVNLLLYVLTLGFIVYALNMYVRAQRERDVVFRLARRIAVMDARDRYTDRLREPVVRPAYPPPPAFPSKDPQD